MRLKRRLILSIILAILFSILPAYSANAQILEPDILGSSPAESVANIPREQGRKGLELKFCYLDDTTGTSNCFPTSSPNFSSEGFPLDMSGANVTVRLNPAADITCTPGINPAPGNCGYQVVDGNDGESGEGDGVENYVEIFYNGDLPGLTSIRYSVTDAVADTETPQSVTAPSAVNFTTGNTEPRPPVSVEVVLDISGSMGWPTVPGGATTRMAALKQAAQAFFLMLNDYARLGDKIGAVYFSNAATVFDPTPGGTNLEPAHDPAQVSLIQADVDGQVPTNSTSIGAGLEAANTAGFLADTDAAPNVRQGILLFSDGEQNRDPRVEVVGSNLQLVSGTDPAVAYPAEIDVCPITLGQQTAPGFALMQSIAGVRCDNLNLHISDSQETFVPAELESYFMGLFNDWFEGDKLEISQDITGKISKSQVLELPFRGNSQDVSLSVLLSWQGDNLEQEEPLTFQLLAPDGEPVTLTNHLQIGRNMSLITLPMPLRQQERAIDPEGQWTVRLLGKRIRSAQLDYHMMVIEDNATLKSSFRTVVQDPGTGEPIPVQVQLTDKDKPVLNATVTAKVRGPREGLGDILSRTQISGSPQSLDDKLRLLATNSQYAGLFEIDTLPLYLHDDGKDINGDSVAGDGIYSGLFNGALEEGHYNFTFDVRGKSDLNGEFDRTKKFSVFVRPKPCTYRTNLQASNTRRLSNGGSQTTITARPKDCLGNNFGPGYADLLEVTALKGQAVSSLKDNLDGSYKINYQLPRGVSNSRVSLEFVGTPYLKRTRIIDRDLTDIGFRTPPILDDRIQLPDDRIQLPGDRIQLPGDRIQLPGDRIQLPGDRIQLPGNRIPIR